AHGGLGLGHHPIKVIFCDNTLVPAVGVQCANSGVAAHVIATAGDFDVFGVLDDPIFDAAGISRVGIEPITTTDYTDPGSYPIDAGATLANIGLVYLFKKLGYSSFATTTSNTAA